MIKILTKSYRLLQISKKVNFYFLPCSIIISIFFKLTFLKLGGYYMIALYDFVKWSGDFMGVTFFLFSKKFPSYYGGKNFQFQKF